MSFTRVKPSNWGVGEKLTSSQVNTADARWPSVIDGGAGGTYAPSGLISVGGSGFRVTTVLSVTGTGSVNLYSGAVVVDSTSATFQGIQVDFGTLSTVIFENGFNVVTGDATVTAGDFTVVAGDLEVTAGSLTVGGTANLNGNAIVTGSMSLLGSTTAAAVACSSLLVASVITLDATHLTTTSAVTAAFAGPVTLSNTTTLTGIIQQSGAGRMRGRASVTLANTDATISVATSDTFYTPAITADRAYTLTSAGAADGDRVVINAQAATAHAAQIVDDGAAPLAGLQNGGGNLVIVEFEFVSGAWRQRQASRS